jgi:hypothetical protein
VAIDFSQYTPPGVYVEASDVQGLFGTLGIPTATVSIVGFARGYQTYTQAVALNTIPVALVKSGILPDGTADDIPNLTVTTFHGETLIQNADYLLVRGTTPSAPQGTTTIAWRPGTPKVMEGEIVTVSYAYTDEFYFAPKAFDDYTVVEQTYGPAMVDVLPTASVAGNSSASSQVNSPLSLATRIAFANGAGTVICQALEPITTGETYQQRFVEAYQNLSLSYSHTMIVPVFDQKSMGVDDVTYRTSLLSMISDVRAHCESQSALGYGRIALVGGDTVMDQPGVDLVTHQSLAQGTKSSRVILAYPPRLNFFNASLGQSTEIGGTYLAAAYAGVLAANDVNRGLTQQTVYGFLGIPEALRSEMDMATKNSLSASGVAVSELGRTSALVCRHGVTTDMTDLSTREVSLTRVNDLLHQMMSEAMIAAQLIGDPIDELMTTRVKSVVVSVLESVVADGLIIEYLDVLARQQAAPGGDPTVIECLFTYRPMLPLNYITIGFTMDLSTGAVTPAEEQVLV